jgi:hypothetical protein
MAKRLEFYSTALLFHTHKIRIDYGNREWPYVWLWSHEERSDLCSCSTSLLTHRGLQPELRWSLHGLVRTWWLCLTGEYWGKNWTSLQLEFLQHKTTFTFGSGNSTLVKDWYTDTHNWKMNKLENLCMVHLFRHLQSLLIIPKTIAFMERYAVVEHRKACMFWCKVSINIVWF